jgi:hypothetical protein
MRKNKMHRSLNIFASFLVPHRIDPRDLSRIIKSEKPENGEGSQRVEKFIIK